MTQSTFIAALLDPASPTPDGLLRPDGKPAGNRFSVYRNNVAVGLTDALRTAFPVVRKLVGETFFTAMAGEFLRRHPPETRIMMLYGAAFPAFLETFPPVAYLPYLPDVARLEQALRESYHAADAQPVDPATLATLTESDLLSSRLTLAPAMRLIRSRWPVHAIWQANTKGGSVGVSVGQDCLILRPEFDPVLHLLPRGGGDFLLAVLFGATLSEALQAASPEFDLAAVLATLLSGQAIIGVAP